MKKSNLFLIPTILFVCSIIISSCGGKSSAEATAGSNAKAKEFANSMCKIADEIGLDENFKLTEDYLNKKEDKFEENALNKSDDIIRLLKQVDKHMGSLNNDQKTAFTKELMKAIIDTKCSDIFFKGIPYHDLGKLIETIENDATTLLKGSEVCNCSDIYLAITKEANAAKDDQKKIDAVQKKYEKDLESCNDLFLEKYKGNQDKIEKELNKCPSYKEVKKIMEKMNNPQGL